MIHRTDETKVRRLIRRVVSTIGIAALVALPGAAFAYEAGPVANGGSIAGSVKYKGTPPPRETLDVNKDKEVCAVSPKLSRDLVVAADGGIQYAVVSIVKITKGKPFPEGGAVLDQKGCEYMPHVVQLKAGGELEIKNSDGILHNIHTYSKENPPVNRAQPKFKKTLKETFDKPEMVKLTCDVHGWMTGWMAVEEHPYVAVTDEKGAFSLADVPAGDYELRVWQEKLGEMTQKVTVQPGAETKVEFELAPK
jgi:plastocyanin